MKSWIIILIILGTALATYSAYDTGHPLSTKAIQNKCMEILNQFISNHPDNLQCEITNGDGADNISGTHVIYAYKAQDGSKLIIDLTLKKARLVDKYGSSVALPIKD